MADVEVVTMNVPVAGGGIAIITEKFVDQGDGTYARKVAAEFTGEISGLSTEATQLLVKAGVGETSDAAVVTDTTGSLSGKLRGLVKWAFERMPASLGQKTKAASLPVVIASDQDTLSTSIPSLLIPDTFKSLKAATITTIATVWTPASGKKVRLMGGTISVNAAVSVLFEDNAAGTDVFQTPVLAANSPYNFDLGNGKLLAAVNNVLKATSSAAATITGTLYGIEV